MTRLTTDSDFARRHRARHDHAMATPRVLIFDDGQGLFGPMTDRRPAFSIRTGALTNRQRIEARLGVAATDLHVGESLVAVQRAVEPAAHVNEPLSRADSPVLIVNGRWTGVEHVDVVRSLPLGRALVQRDQQILAAHLAAKDAQALREGGFAQLPSSIVRTTLDISVLLGRPWHILDQLEPTLACDLAPIQSRVAPTARVHPTAVIDDAAGPVVIADHATVGPLAILEGPCYIGPHGVVVARTFLRRNTVVGPHCKVAGEISFSIVHSHSSKSHEGYLGHSLVGQWVNLGAATNVSNLKNTYGDVSVQLSRKTAPEDTGRTFVGPIIGDFVRTAIGTRLTTGCVLGTAAMIATSTFAPKHVERFAFLTDKGSMPTDIEKLIATARIMMSRRELQLSPEEEKLLRELART